MSVGFQSTVALLLGTALALAAEAPTTAPTTAPSVTFAARSIEKRTTVRWADSTQPSDELTLTIQGQPDPDPEITVDRDGFTVTSLSDESGKNLLPAETYSDRTNVQFDQGKITLQVRGPVDVHDVNGTLKLTGSLRCVIINSKTTIELPDVEKEPTTRDVCGFPVTIALKRTGNGSTLRLSGNQPAGADPAEYQRFLKRLYETWFATAQLTDSGGKSLQSSSGGATLYKDRIDMYRNFDAPAEGPVSLSWTVPSSVTTAEVPVAVDHITVP